MGSRGRWISIEIQFGLQKEFQSGQGTTFNYTEEPGLQKKKKSKRRGGCEERRRRRERRREEKEGEEKERTRK